MDFITAQIIMAFGFGVTFVVMMVVLAIKFPHPTPFQYNIFRIVISLATAGAAAMIPGFINVELEQTAGLLIRGGGALAVFAIVFFFNPAQLAVESILEDECNPPESTTSHTSILDSIWDSLDHNLQEALALAATLAHNQGEDIISTRTLFSAQRHLHPEPLLAFFSQLPSDALPEPVADDVKVEANAIEGIRDLSTDVKDSLAHLTPQATAKHKLSCKDIFIDIAKNGNEEAVLSLRKSGVDVNKINDIVKELGWSVTERV